MSKNLKTYDLMSIKCEDKTEDWKSSVDRFGDDLTELILSYLPISEKIRLECTSKQVQSLIFNKQKCLRITNGYSEESVNHFNELLLKYRSDPKQVKYRQFGSVLKKFTNLDTIRIEGKINVDFNLIQTIADNCSTRLKTLWIYDKLVMSRHQEQTNVITFEYFKSLAQKCGSSLRSLRANNLPEKQLKQLLYSCPELRSVTVIDIQSVITEPNIFEECFLNSEELPKFLPKLQEIEFFSCNEKTLIQFQKEYSDNILKICARLVSKDFTSDSMTRALTGFGLFRRLQSLEVSIFDTEGTNTQFISNGLNQLAEQCLQLKKLSLTFVGNLFGHNWVSILSSFKSLSYLHICLRDDYRNSFSYDRSISDLSHLKQLKHLSLTLKELSDSCVENIHIYLPQLESIRFNTSKAITDKSLIFLSQMKYLSKLEIICFNTEKEQNITDKGVKQLIDGCPRITTLLLKQKNHNLDFDITEKSIEALITRCKRMPKVIHDFGFVMKSVEKRSRFNNSSLCLPPNLAMKIFIYK